MILQIKKYSNSVLRKKCEKVKEITPEIKKLVEDMIETMKKEQGVGLAAPQVGVSKRVIIAETENGVKEFINPKILKKSKETEIMEEGCLSVPNLRLKIKRWKEVEIESLDGDGKKIKTEGILARILQHEIDHLNGILFIDRIGKLERFRIRNKLKELEKKYGSDR